MKTGEEEGEGEASEEKMRLNIKKNERDWQSYVHDHAEPPASILNSPPLPPELVTAVPTTESANY